MLFRTGSSVSWISTVFLGIFCLGQGCQVETPNTRGNSRTQRNQEKVDVISALNRRIEKSGPALDVIRSLAALGKMRTQGDMQAGSSTNALIVPSGSSLMNGDGMLTDYDQETGKYEYQLTSEAAFQLAAAGDQLGLSLNGYVKQVDGKPTVITSELTAKYVHQNRESNFRIFYEDNDAQTNGSSIEITVDFGELERLYAAITTGVTDIVEESHGTLKIKIDEHSTLVEGTGLLVSGQTYDVEFAKLSIKLQDSGPMRQEIQVDGTIVKKSGEQVGEIRVESNSNGQNGTVMIKVIFND
jgi:hypothetical protein